MGNRFETNRSRDSFPGDSMEGMAVKRNDEVGIIKRLNRARELYILLPNRSWNPVDEGSQYRCDYSKMRRFKLKSDIELRKGLGRGEKLAGMRPRASGGGNDERTKTRKMSERQNNRVKALFEGQ